jgi:WD40 repeat protein
MRYLLAILFILTMVRGILPQDDPPTIPVVKTWQELQALPPIELGDGVKIRLGLEAVKVPQWSGALLYCLADGYTPPSGGSGARPFGPVYADFTFENDKAPVSQMRWGFNGKRPKGTYLYVRAFPAARVGNYRVTVTDRQGKVLARAQVMGTKDFFHPWMPWLQGLDEPVTPAEGIALPSVDSLGPLTFIGPGKAKQGRLPTLLPSEQEPSLTIKLEGKEIVIRAKSEFTTSRPDYHFLARWWVNGKPFVPKQTDRLWEYAGYGLVSEGKELRLGFTFLPERLGAKPGDKIGLQLMHSEGQWAWCAGTSLRKYGGTSRRNGENVRVSNRIEFNVPSRKSKTVSLAFSPDGRRLVSLDSDQTLRLYDVTSGKILKQDTIPLDKDERAEQVGFGPNGTMIVLVSKGGIRFDRARGVAVQGDVSTCLWNASTRKRSPWVITGYGGMAVSPDGTFLAHGDGLWETATGKKIRKFPIPEGLIYEIRFSPDGKILAHWICESLAQNTSMIVLADVASGKKLLQIGDLAAEIPHFCFRSPATFSTDGKMIAFSELRSPPDYPIRVWNVSANKEVQRVPQKEYADQLGFSADGRTVLSWDRRHGLVHLWETATGKLRQSLKIGGGVQALTFSPDGRTAALVKDGTIEFRRLK